MSDYRRDNYGSNADVLSARLANASNRSAPKSPSEALQPEPVPPPPLRSRAARHPLVVFLNFVLTMVIIAVVVLGAGLIFGRMQFERAGDLDQARSVAIERGTSLSNIADLLLKNGAISSKWLFIAGVWLNREQDNLKAGEYLIPAHASMQEIMESMVEGKGILYSVSIPEGLTTAQVIERLKANDVLVGDVGRVPPEGSLLPETYKFTRGDTRDNLLARMQRDRDRVVTDIWNRRASDLPLSTPEEMVTLASIVEKETALADERSRVAAVFINRLRLKMPLQSDPTVIYGMFGSAGKPDDFRLSRADLEKDSPYNTYTIPALPPGPIANPGRASLEAVVNPSRTRDVYFVADGTGGHAFAETYEDHLRNVARWREINGQPAEEPAPEAAADPDAAPPDGEAPADGAEEPGLEEPLALTPPAN